MHRFAPIDASSQTLSAQLYPDEHVIAQQDGVGLYDGKDKAPEYFDGRLYLTSHRLVFINSNRRAQSIALALDTVEQTEYWTGFLKSSPKITLLLSAPASPASNGQPTRDSSASAMTSTISSANNFASTSKTMFLSPEEANNALAGQRTWVCRVCGMRNTPSAQSGGAKCSLCGVSRDKQASSSPVPGATSSASSPASLAASRSPTPRIDRDPYGRTGTPPPLPPPPPSQQLVKPAEANLKSTDPADSRIACPACTFLNHHSMSSCEVCDTPLHSAKRTIDQKPDLASRSSTPGHESDAIKRSSLSPSPSLPVFVRLSFRKGGERTFYAALKEALSKKAWDYDRPSTTSKDGNSSTTTSAGIDAIMKGFDLNTRDRDDSMEDALKDLDALMRKAKEMISLAKSMNERLSAVQASNSLSNSTEAAEAKAASSLASTSLARIGLIDAPVTTDMVSDQTGYNHELAKELGSILCRKDSGGLIEKGVMGLDEVWCLWNRARGVALVPPSSLRSCAQFLPLYTSPRISLQTFKSGLTILHTPKHSLQAFSNRLLDALDVKVAMSLSWSETLQQQGDFVGEGGVSLVEEGSTRAERQGMTLLEIARNERESTTTTATTRSDVSGGVSFNLIKEMVEHAETVRGVVCRDEQSGQGTRWFRNHISDPNWELEWDGTR
ncbi:hypothetical protein ACM66B_006878 [Microbotryomycetes sp. NB124-2]